MVSFLVIFQIALWLIAVVTILFYVVISISVSGKVSSMIESGLSTQAQLSLEQKRNYIKSLESSRRTARLTQSNLMVVTGVIFFILDVLAIQANQDSSNNWSSYLFLSVLCAFVAGFDYYRYCRLKLKTC
ncbi:MAG: hypothetical protein WAV98_01470 [Minisyncoccia bacterium]